MHDFVHVLTGLDTSGLPACVCVHMQRVYLAAPTRIHCFLGSAQTMDEFLEATLREWEEEAEAEKELQKKKEKEASEKLMKAKEDFKARSTRSRSRSLKKSKPEAQGRQAAKAQARPRPERREYTDEELESMLKYI